MQPSLPSYHLCPPSWRPPLHQTADLGYPDFFPSRPGHGQDEDCLSEAFVKQGYVSKWGISNSSESFSVHGLVLKDLISTGAIKHMNETMSKIVSLRNTSSSEIPPSTYKPPARLILHESKRQTFVADLANPAVPLSKLARSAPHGMKGPEVLEMMSSHDVPVERAIWLIKILGAAELTSRSKSNPSFSSTIPNTTQQPSVDLTTSLTTSLKRQLSELTVPSNLPLQLRTSTTASSHANGSKSPSTPNSSTSAGPTTNAAATSSSSSSTTSAPPNTTAQGGTKPPFKSILAHPASLKKWIKKWTYTLSVLRLAYSPRHSLIDKRNFLSWLVNQLTPGLANRVQIGFVLALVEEWTEEIEESGVLSRMLVENGLGVWKDLESGEGGGDGRRRVAKIIQTIFLLSPHLFVFPRLYLTHLPLLNTLLSSPSSGEITLPPGQARDDPMAKEVVRVMDEAWGEVRKRNEALLFRDWDGVGRLAGVGRGEGKGWGGGDGWSERREGLAGIQILDSISSETDMNSITRSFFSSSSTGGGAGPDSFPQKLNILLSWASAHLIPPSSASAPRAYTVSTVLTLYILSASSPSSRKARIQSVEHDIWRWLRESKVAKKEKNVECVAEVMGELVRKGVIRFESGLIGLMVRGEAVRPRMPIEEGEEEEKEEGEHPEGKEHHNQPSHLVKLLRSTPLYASTQSLLNQRYSVLFGSLLPVQSSIYTAGTDSSESETDELSELRTVHAEVERSLAHLWTRGEVSRLERGPIGERAPALMRSSRFIQIKVVKDILDWFVLDESTGSLFSIESPDALAEVLEILEVTRNFVIMLKILLRLLDYTQSITLLPALMDAFSRSGNIWQSMGAKSTIVEVLLEKHCALKDGVGQQRCVLEMLVRAAQEGLLEGDAKSMVWSDFAVFEKSLTPMNVHATPPSPNMVEVQMLCHENDPQASAALATTLWYRHQSFDEWPYFVWDNVVLALAQLASAVADPVERNLVVDRYARFLQNIHEHLSLGLDKHISRWCADKVAIGETSWFVVGELADPITMLLLNLVSMGCLKSSSILVEIVLPVWKGASMDLTTRKSIPSTGFPLAPSLIAANTLASQLLLVDAPPFPEPPFPSLPPTTLEQVHRFQTCREPCFHDTTFIKLVTHLPFLVALEVIIPADDPLSSSVSLLRQRISKHPSLKVASFKHSNIIKEAFLKPAWSQGSKTSESDKHGLDERLIDALKTIVSDGTKIDPTQSPAVYDWRKVVTRLNPWRWSQSVFELQLSLKQLAIRLASPISFMDANSKLNNLTRTVFERHLSSDETDLLSEALKGLDAGPVEKFAIAGINRLADLLVNFDVSSSSVVSRIDIFTESVGNVIRIVACALAQAPTPTADKQSLYVDTSLQDRYFEAILSMINKLEAHLSVRYSTLGTDHPPGSLSTVELRSLLVLSLRLLHIDLGLSRYNISQIWTTKTKGYVASFMGVLFRLIVMHAGTAVLDQSLFCLLLDTMWYYTDEIPKEARVGGMNALRLLQAEEYDPFGLIPDELRLQIRQFLPFIAPEPLIEGLGVLSIKPPGSSAVIITPVQARPWEWLDHVEPYNSTSSQYETNLPGRIKNSTSLSLSLLQSEGTREPLPPPSSIKALHGDSSSKAAGPAVGFSQILSERSYADSSEGMPIFAREWLSSSGRYSFRQNEANVLDSQGTQPSQPSTASPAPTAESDLKPPAPAKARPVPKKRKASLSSVPTKSRQTGATAADAVVVLDDDESEIMPTLPPPPKKAKGKAVPPKKEGLGKGGKKK